MSKIYLLDCTLRDGGYVNDWNFGQEAIKGFSRKIAQTGIEFYEVGFLKGNDYDPDKSVFPDLNTIAKVIAPKDRRLKYLAMLDMKDPIPLERIPEYDGSSIDGIRIIFKKERIEEAYDYVKAVLKLGYFVSVNFVSTDSYQDEEFIAGINKFNELHPHAMAIVDTFGTIKRKQFIHYAKLAHEHMAKDIILAYHAHNNLQQAMGNTESLIELELDRDLLIDACVFGMGRGAGNLNLELFAEYMNENFDTHYKIEPMLEIMDDYLQDIYKSRFWGYSLPMYLTATTGCHPNYGIFLAEKDTLKVKATNELLASISPEDKVNFTKKKAEEYYRRYMEQYIDDGPSMKRLSDQLLGKRLLILAPGRSLREYEDRIRDYMADPDTVTVAVNFAGDDFNPDYVFSANMRRFGSIMGKTRAKTITTSNMGVESDFVVNFASYAPKEADIIDNSGLMMLRILMAAGVKSVAIAGMDGYSKGNKDYCDSRLEFDFSKQTDRRNNLISTELKEIMKHIEVEFITPTSYVQ